jgi:alkaline phosphatase
MIMMFYLQVIMGGGRREMLPNVSDPLAATSGKRLDGLDLTEMWHVDKVEKNATHQYVTDRNELMKVGN